MEQCRWDFCSDMIETAILMCLPSSTWNHFQNNATHTIVQELRYIAKEVNQHNQTNCIHRASTKQLPRNGSKRNCVYYWLSMVSQHFPTLWPWAICRRFAKSVTMHRHPRARDSEPLRIIISPHPRLRRNAWGWPGYQRARVLSPGQFDFSRRPLSAWITLDTSTMHPWMPSWTGCHSVSLVVILTFAKTPCLSTPPCPAICATALGCNHNIADLLLCEPRAYCASRRDIERLKWGNRVVYQGLTMVLSAYKNMIYSRWLVSFHVVSDWPYTRLWISILQRHSVKATFSDKMFSMNSPATLVVLGIISLCLCLAYRAILPKPIAGIPFNKDAAGRMLGDIPEMIAYVRRTKRIFVGNHRCALRRVQ